MTAPVDARVAQALAVLAEADLIADAMRAAGVPTGQATVMIRILAAAVAAGPDAPPAIELDLLAQQTGLSHADVARHLADLIRAGWIAKDDTGHWRPAIAPHVHAGRPGTRPAPEPA